MMSRTLVLFIACYAMQAQQSPDAFEKELAALQARFTEPANPHDKEWVKRRIEHLYNVDQFGRGAYIRTPTKEIANRVTVVAKQHTAELKELLKIYRWFTISEFGEEIERDAWVLVQHSDFDPAFQREVLAILETLLPKHETSPNSFAKLWDRVARAAGKPQRYGTGGSCAGPGQYVPYPSEDPDHLDERRTAIGLSTMAEYLQRSKDKGYCP